MAFEVQKIDVNETFSDEEKEFLKLHRAEEND